jgi:hypothetical protein
MLDQDEKVRVTLVVPRWLDREIEIVAAETGQPKNVVVTSALSASLPNARKRPSQNSPSSPRQSRKNGRAAD